MIVICTQLFDANLLQVLPGDVSDILNFTVALASQRLMIHAQSQQVEPLDQVMLK